MAGESALGLDRPRDAPQLLAKTFEVYRRFPFLFLALAGAVVVPYELILLAVTGNGPYAQRHDGFVVSEILGLVTLGVLGPLVSALHVHALREIVGGNEPRLRKVAERSLAVLPVAAVAVVISFVGTIAGLVALIVPGVLLWLRWAVVAQAAALEPAGWKGALRRSADLTEGHYAHVLALCLPVAVITLAPAFAARRAFGEDHTTVASFLVGTGLEVILWSFGALATGLLFFDLKARLREEAARPAPTPEVSGARAPGWYIDPASPKRMRYWSAEDGGSWSQTTTGTPKAMLREWQEGQEQDAAGAVLASAGGEHTGHSLDPGAYTDAGRPPGWYVDPDRPWRMRYWGSGGKPGWSADTMKTPEKAQSEWRDLRWRR